jgi:ParB-like nuclease domain
MPRDEAGAIGEIGWRPTEVHPLADLFPMMHADELAELAEDILINGLLHPIVIDVDGVLIDGRNRLAACERAGVEPVWQELNGHDAQAFIVSANLARRNLSKGQQAMALAMIYPEPAALKRKGSGSLDSKEQGISSALLSQARAILRHSTELAQDVLHRGEHFDVALKKVQAETQNRKGHDAQMADLRTHAPDVAALVTDGRLTLEAAMAELGERQQFVLRAIKHGQDSARRFAGLAAHLTVIKTAAGLTDADLAMVGRKREDADPLAELTEADLNGLIDAAEAVNAMMGETP